MAHQPHSKGAVMQSHHTKPMSRTQRTRVAIISLQRTSTIGLRVVAAMIVKMDGRVAILSMLRTWTICFRVVTVMIVKMSPNESIWQTAHRNLFNVNRAYLQQEVRHPHSSRAFRAARYSMQPAACHGSIAKGCIGYLLQYEKGLIDRFESAKSLQQVYALAQYSAEHWMIHTRNGEEENQLSDLVTKFLSTGDGAYLNWLRLYDPDSQWNSSYFRRELDSCPNPLYYASLSGLAGAASRIVQEGADINAEGGACGNALQAASSRGYDKIVEVLLSKGADVNAQGGAYGNAL
ncbi:hypothetical protein VE00_07269 [Pseudogymnoascus sp. WSF 3629]|nr:hypothetical protein VE00_07269 [Pseudogymnoascus sp. WSF 3629]